MKFHRVMLWAALFVVTFCGAVMAQDTGSITGTVKDSSGAEVAGAAVQVSSDTHGINRQTVSNATGDFSEAALPGGTYDVIVTAPGFKKTQVKGVVLDVAQKARVDITLQVGTINTEIVVQGEDVAQVETQSSELAGTVTGKEISQLELNGRNFTQLATLTPGVSNQTGQDEGTVGVYGSVSFSMNGGRTEYNNWELDGGDNMDNGSNGSLNVYPSLDAIAEFKVLTSNYGAQYGRNGSGTVEVETKSGTNSFHGNVYEYLRNDDFNSPAWFEGGVAPEYKKNDYGYTLGGPVFIPNHYNKDKKKTFFFWSEEWRKDLVPGQTFNLPVPSVAERGGNFDDLCQGVPATFQRTDGQGNLEPYADCPGTAVVGQPGNFNPYPGNNVPFNSTDPVVGALLTMIPSPSAGSLNNFTASPAQATNWREELIRVDQNINDKNRATFRFIHDSWNTTTAVPLWTNQGSFPTIQSAFKGPGVGLVARLTTTASPTLLNEFVFSYTTDHIILNDTGNWKRPASFSSGFTDLFPGNGGGVLPGINLVDPNGAYGNFGEDAGYIPNGVYNSNPTYTFRDNVSKTLGKHVLQFGVYLAFAQKNEFGGELASGSYPGYLTFDPNKDNATTGNPFADLLLGNIYSFGQQDHLLKYYNRYKLYEPYFQDDWRITNRLTLNLGIRLSLYETYREKQKQAFNFDPKHYVAGQTTVNQDDSVNFLTADGGIPSLTDLPNGMVQCGVTPGVPDGCMKQHIFNPAPRIGFAWDPKGDGKWAVRGGYGVFFEHTNGNEANTESLENSPPLATVVQKLQIPGYENINSGAASQQFPLNVNSIPDKAIYPYMQQWHFDIQHDVAKNTIATVSYVGSKGTHLTRQSDLNQLMPTPINQNPFQSGESFGATACTNPDAFGIPQNGTTPSGTVIPYSVNSNGLPSGPAVNVGIANCGALPDPLRPFPGYGTITHLESAASSTYHAFQASLRRNVGQFTISAAYTYSHSIDDSSDRSDGGLVNTYNFATNRASSNFDERHIFNFSYVWDVPFFKGKGITHAFLGGWEYSGIVGISSGTPFSVLSSGDIAGVGSGVGDGARADLVGDPNQVVRAATAGTGPLWYNPNAFATASPLTFGNTGRNDLRNPRRTNFDMALFKQFPVHEAMAFQFRAEAYNVFNHTEWGGIAGDSGSAGGAGNNTVGADNFLFVTTVHNPRILQLALKFIF